MQKNQWYILSQEPCGSEGSFILFLQLMLLTKTINKPVTKNGIENKNNKEKNNANGTFVKRWNTWRF
jgi:hypothetical protein